MTEEKLRREDTLEGEGGAPRSDPRDERRCRRVEDALYRRACGYKVKLKKTFKLKRVDYDPDTGKKLTEKELLETGFEEVHIPADMRVCAYYLNNRDPARWREHPAAEGELIPGGAVEYPPMEELDDPDGDGSPAGEP